MCHDTECSAHRQPPPSRDPLLPLLIDGLNAFLAGVVGLILIFRRHFLGYTVEFVMIFLLILTLLFFFIHLITSWIVCALPLLLCMPSPGFMGQNSPHLSFPGILKNKITAPVSKTLKPIIPVGIGPSKLLFEDNDIHVPTSPIISAAP